MGLQSRSIRITTQITLVSKGDDDTQGDWSIFVTVLFLLYLKLFHGTNNAEVGLFQNVAGV